MIVIQAKDINKSYADNIILNNISLAINEKERVGLVGDNGCGKTTLLNCLSGQMEADNGEVIKSGMLSIAYLQQLPQQPARFTAWDAVMSSFSDILTQREKLQQLEEKISGGGEKLEYLMRQYADLMEDYDRNNGYACENTARRILSGLGFSEQEYAKQLGQFSGGQKTRINMGRLLALSPDILMLDEPTNHLDMEAVEWLENYLADYPGTLIVVSHDRRFLDRVATRIVELRNGNLRSYPGNYSAYCKLKNADAEAERRAYEKQQQYIKETEEYIRRFKAGIKSKQARGRETRLERLERLDRPTDEINIGTWSIKMDYESGQDVFKLEGISKSFGDNQVIENINMDIYRGEKIALIGPNGSGKTTILQIISGHLKPDRGTVKKGSRVKLAYFTQQFEDLDPENSVLDELVLNYDISIGHARNLLGRMLFRDDDVFKEVKNLSGGEKGRLAILKMFLSGANFLLLDEPTNHLDIASRQAVEDMLRAYPGTVLLVSHDRYLIDRVATRVIAIKERHLRTYPGNYSYYMEKIQQEKAGRAQAADRTNVLSKQQEFRQKQKDEERERRRLLKSFQDVEDTIMELEHQKARLEASLATPEVYSDEVKAQDCLSQYEKVKEDLDHAYHKWEETYEKIEEAGI